MIISLILLIIALVLAIIALVPHNTRVPFAAISLLLLCIWGLLVTLGALPA
jgi:hypothetical protein